MESTLSLSLIILLYILTLVSSQSPYVLPEHYFINCGSNSDIKFTGKTFTGDENRPTFSFSGGHKAVNNNPASNTSEIYQTARVFTQKSWYKLEADRNNSFVMVKLHFSPFSYNRFELSTSKFSVSVSGFSLLSNFNVGNSTVIKEFIIPIGLEQKLRIQFIPASGSSPAFVNAIEAFTTPSELFRHGVSPPHISPARKNGDMELNISSSYAFNPIHRINVGGDRINVESDTLRRNWTPDDGFIVNSESSENVSGTVVTFSNFATRYDAPENVYKTAKKLKVNSSEKNITWNFGVNKNSMYLVRAHFCDFISTGLNTSDDAFNFFIYSHYKMVINPGNTVGAVQVPFYVDFVVDSVEFGFVNVSIGAISGNSQPVLLNGLEIMELLKNSGVVEAWDDEKKSKKMYTVVGCVAGGLFFALLIGFVIGFKCRKTKPYTSMNTDYTVNNMPYIPNMNLNIRFDDIQQATNNFDEGLVIGKGGFGTVYKGTLPGGKMVAVKRGGKGHSQGQAEFVREIEVLSKVQHQHLVALIGYCHEKSEMILVYEYMERGTLQQHLYDKGKDVEKLSWSKRLEICINAAEGLNYLHTGRGIIHRDVKSTNILLNEKYVAKVADFGISRLDNSEQSLVDVKGTFGYWDPEYISGAAPTPKLDVYCFGVVLLEVLCARPAFDKTLPENERNLAEWAIKQIKEGKVVKIVDPYLVDKINLESLQKYLEMVEKCLNHTGEGRPSMESVIWSLQYALKLDKEQYDQDNMVNTTLQFSTSMIDGLPSEFDDDEYEVNDNSASSYPSESQEFSQLKIGEKGT